MQGKKPFIKLFRTPNSCYCFDVNQNEILELSIDSFQYLQQLLCGQPPTAGIPIEVKELMDVGYFATESNVKYVKHALTDYIGDYLDRRLLKLTLQVTQNCNFRCKYCVYSENSNKGQRAHSTKNMSWETAKKAVDFLWKHSIDTDYVNIGFYGGEPLLCMEIIQQVIAYSEKLFLGKELSFNITTNGTLLNEKYIQYFKKHNVSLMISLDGNKEINDSNRVLQDGTGTYDIVMKKIAMVRQVEPDYAKKMQISVVIDPQKDFDCFNSIYIQEKDFDHLFVAATVVDKEYDNDKIDMSETYIWKSKYHRFLGVLSYLKRIDKDYVSPIVYLSVMADIKRCHDMDLYHRLLEIDAPGGPCIPGQLRLFCNVDKKLFPCERVSETSSISCIGSLDEGFNMENVKKFLNVGQVAGEECKYCWSFRYCILCGKKADDGHGKMDPQIKLKHCPESRSSAEIIFKLKLLFKEVPNYYGKQCFEVQEE